MKILLCEDSPEMTSMLLDEQTDNIEFYAFSEREGAVDAARSTFFDVAIVDLNLIGDQAADYHTGGGVYVIDEIKKLDYGTRLIALTANDDPDLSFRLSKYHGVDAYVNKLKRDSVIQTMEHVDDLTPAAINYPTTDRYGMHVSGIHNAASRQNWEYLLSSTLNHRGGEGAEKCKTKIIEQLYPFCHRKSDPGLLVDPKTKSIEGTVWSLRMGRAVRVVIEDTEAEHPSALKSLKLSKKKFINVYGVEDDRSLFYETAHEFGDL